MRSPVRIRVAAPDTPCIYDAGALVFYKLLLTKAGLFLFFRGCLELLLSLRAAFRFAEAESGSHLPRERVKLACKGRARKSSLKANTRVYDAGALVFITKAKVSGAATLVLGSALCERHRIRFAFAAMARQAGFKGRARKSSLKANTRVYDAGALVFSL